MKLNRLHRHSALAPRTGRGSSLPECVSVIALVIPVVVSITMVAIEASHACLISTKMTQGAHMAARALASQYDSNPAVQFDLAMQQSVLSNVRIDSYVVDNSQFELNSNSWNTASCPPTVSVVCKYLPGVGKPALAAFPSYDPLGVGSSFGIKAKATWSLQ